MNKQEMIQEAAVGTTVDAEGLLSGLLAGQVAPRSEFEMLLEQPVKPETSVREQIINAAIAAVQSGEFFPQRGVYYHMAGTRMSQPCGCAIAALYYAGQKLGFVDDVRYAPGHVIRQDLQKHLGDKGMSIPLTKDGHRDVEHKFENYRYSYVPTGEHMVACLNSMLEA